MTSVETREARVMVKLAGSAAPPDEVLFKYGEREAVVGAALEAGYEHLSTFIRELCVDVALSGMDRKGRTDRQLLQAAAVSCDMKLGAWMRTVTLAGIGQVEEVETPLPKHKREAARWYKRKAG